MISSSKPAQSNLQIATTTHFKFSSLDTINFVQDRLTESCRTLKGNTKALSTEPLMYLQQDHGLRIFLINTLQA